MGNGVPFSMSLGVHGMVETPQGRYDASNTRQIKLKLNRKTDADILARLAEEENKQGYIKTLIRKDIEKESGK